MTPFQKLIKAIRSVDRHSDSVASDLDAHGCHQNSWWKATQHLRGILDLIDSIEKKSTIHIDQIYDVPTKRIPQGALTNEQLWSSYYATALQTFANARSTQAMSMAIELADEALREHRKRWREP